jgi:serpin B
MKKVIYYVIAATLVAMPLTGCNSDEEIVKEPENANLPDEEKEPIKEEQENAVRSIHLTDVQKQAVSRNNDFAFNFYRAMSQTEELKSKSNIVSPLSLTYVLGMLNAGATGQTGSEILKLLGFGEGDSQTVNELCKELIDNAPGVDNAVTLRLANLVATASNHSFTLADDYSQTVKGYYDCEATSLDFNSQTAVDYINGWCKEKTEGMIPSIVSKKEIESAVLALLNAVYFKAPWTNPFNKEETRDMSFTRENGEKQNLPMMHRDNALFYAPGDIFKTLGLSYGSGKNWTMYILLPNEGKTVNDVLSSLSAKMWAEYTYAASMFSESGLTTMVDVLLPRFKTENSSNLNDVIAGMGAPSMFLPRQEFSRISPTAKDFFVSLVKQNAAIEVTEEGSEAAAVTAAIICTALGDEGGSYMPEFHADHPFVYLIQEASSGAIFFIGTYHGN